MTGPLFRPLLPASVLLAEMLPEHADPEALHPEERTQIVRAVPHRQREFAAGRLLARELLSTAGIPRHVLLPDDDRVPRWPAGMAGSITHCRSLCAVGLVGRDMSAGLGLDVEPAKALNPDLLQMILREPEQARLPEFPELLRPLAGILTFSAKEAVYKAIFPLQRVFLEFQEVEIVWTHAEHSVSRHDDLRGVFEAEVRVPAATVPGLARIIGNYRIANGHIATAVLLPA